MKVIQRLRHGFTAVMFFAVLILIPETSIGQIVTESEPYEPVETGQVEQASNQSVTPEFSQLDLSFLRARQAIAYGDVASAETFRRQTESYANEQSQFGDTVDAIQTLINKQNELAILAKNGDPNYNSKAAGFLIQQATALVKFGDFETSEMLIGQAKKFPVNFKALPISPDTVLAAIANAKNGGADEYAAQQLAVDEVLSLMSQAQLSYDKGNLELAQSFTDQAKSFGIADTKFPANQILPWQLELRIQDAMRSDGSVVAASFQNSATENVVQADYDPANDTTKNVQVAATHAAVGGTGLNNTPEFSPIPSKGMRMFESGMTALKSNNLKAAREYFEMAWGNRQELDEVTQQTIQDQLTSLPNDNSRRAEELQAPSNSDESNGFESRANNSEQSDDSNSDLMADIDQQQKYRKLQSEIFRNRGRAERIREEDPRAAIDMLTKMRQQVVQADINDEIKRPLFTMIERDITDFQNFVEDNLTDIQLREENAAVMSEVRESREKRYNTEQQIQKLVEEFNDLMDEERYAEANMVARQAEELSPDSEIVSLLKNKAMIAINSATMEDVQERKNESFFDRLKDVDEDSINNVNEIVPLVFGERDRWERNSQRRAEWLSNNQYSSESERRIWNMLKNEKVQGHYQGTLSDAIDQLSEQSGINIILDEQALAADSISATSTVDIPIRQPIKMQSALNVILGNAGLVFVVEDEVIKVTSKDAQRRDVKPKTYYVGDLVTPIQNFQNSLSMSFLSPNGPTGSNGFIGQGGAVPLANHNSGSISPVEMASQTYGAGNNVLGQRGLGLLGRDAILGGGPVQSGSPQYNSIGPQALGGVTEADFLPLINLIQNTISPDGWQDTNGDGTVQAFVPNLSLIVSQTQAVQDQIQDLLVQLRELNDVQIVVEVRFVSLSDQFFERIGIDFDFNLNDNSGLNPAAIPEQVNPSAVVGLQPGTSDATPTFTADLDIPFQQTNFLSTIPSFGGFDPGTAANFGFAILSDIEVFFLIQASKGDTRTNITQAPTVTMFNGQVASVNDGAQVPFVTSVTPVVGDFAVAQQPIITLLPEGASLNVQAVVSNDRKSVRMTLVPFFSQIQSVDTFTFDGSTTTQRATDQNLLDDLLGAVTGQDPTPSNTELETTTQGVTIQLPTLGFTTVSTVVSVPDGGTILLGGVKRQTEQRVERGVPFLSNVPYVSRLFKNVGIGRDTSSLMMMVTPRIIIQEEEELEQVGTSRN